MQGFNTKAIHNISLKKDIHGALRLPLYDSAAFSFGSSMDLALAFEGKKPAHAYSRITNPTVEEFEQRIARLSNAVGVIAVSSGMAAIANTIMAIAESGSNIITTKKLFGNTISLFEDTLKPWGLEVRYVNMEDISEIENSIDDNTRTIFLETITNPQLEVVDFKAICDCAKSHSIPVIVDGTLTTPYLFNSKQNGVALELISSTKYISGGATSLGGLIIDNGNFNWSNNPKLKDSAKKFGQFALLMKLRKEVYRNIGACLSPHNAWLQLLGLETMGLRIDKSCENTIELAKILEKEEKVQVVNYPGLKSSPYYLLAKKYFIKGYGGLLTFKLQNKKTCYAFMDALSTIKIATNLNDNKTLILHPASTIFCEYTPEQRELMEVGDDLIRLSVGIEDIEDLICDIKKGLEAI